MPARRLPSRSLRRSIRATRLLLQGSIVRPLLRLARPNILVMLALASTGLIGTWWVSRLGTDALAGMALVLRAQAEKRVAADPLVQRVLKAAADSRRKAT